MYGGEHDEQLVQERRPRQQQAPAAERDNIKQVGIVQHRESKENVTPAHTQERQKQYSAEQPVVHTGDAVEPPADNGLSSNQFASGGHQNSGKCTMNITLISRFSVLMNSSFLFIQMCD